MLAAEVLPKRGARSLIAQDKAPTAGLLGAFCSPPLMIPYHDSSHLKAL